MSEQRLGNHAPFSSCCRACQLSFSEAMLQQFWGPHPQWTMYLSDFIFRAVFQGTAVLVYLLLVSQLTSTVMLVVVVDSVYKYTVYIVYQVH